MWSKFCQTSSCHGVIHIEAAKSKKSKIFWGLVVLAVSCGLVYVLYHTVYQFLKRPAITTTDIVSFKEMNMPDILICQEQSLRLDFLAQRNISHKLGNYIQKILYTTKGPSTNNYTDQEWLELEHEYWHAMKSFPKEDVRELFLNATPECSSLFIECAHRFQPKKCCEGVKVTVDPMHGNCFLFTNISAQIWPETGLFLKLKHQPKEYLPQPAFDNIAEGVSVRIQAQYDPFNTNEVKASSGYLTSIEIGKEVHIYENTILKTVCDPTWDN